MTHRPRILIPPSALAGKIASLDPSGSLAMKAARLAVQDWAKRGFVPSPSMQQQVQQAQQQGVPVQQGPSGNAIAPSGLTLDEVAGMIDQGYQATMPILQQIQQQIADLKASIPVPEGQEGQKDLLDRLSNLERMVGSQSGVPSAAATPVPQPGAAAPAPPAPAPQA